MKIIIIYLVGIILALIIKLAKQNEKIRILENNWETSKKIIGSYDPEFAKYIEMNK